MFRVVLDTCVLVPDLRRDFLLSLADAGAFSPYWGTGILHELDYVLDRIFELRGLDAGERQRRRTRLLTQIDRAFPGATIEAPKGEKFGYDLADQDDEHVVRAALIAKVDLLVSDDRRAAFENCSELVDADVEVLSSAVFAANTVAAHPRQARKALQALCTRRSQSIDDCMEQLSKKGFGDAVSILQ